MNIMVESKLDTNRFGFRVAKLHVEEMSDIDYQKLEEFSLVIARVKTSNIHLINELERKGFTLKDSQFTMKRHLRDYSHKTKSSEIIIRELKPADIEDLLRITVESFDGYGHYFANKELDRSKVREIYSDWAYRSFNGDNPTDKILVAEFKTRPVGFLSFHIVYGISSKFTMGGIGAVDSTFRGKGIFPELLDKGLEWSKKIDAEWCEHNVLTTNFSVIRSMLKKGFSPMNAITTLHYTNL
jgi:ribosomal protein S18 acetylase RimI-like enzyme